MKRKAYVSLEEIKKIFSNPDTLHETIETWERFEKKSIKTHSQKGSPKQELSASGEQ